MDVSLVANVNSGEKDTAPGILRAAGYVEASTGQECTYTLYCGKVAAKQGHQRRPAAENS